MKPDENDKNDPEYQEHLTQESLRYLAKIIVKDYLRKQGIPDIDQEVLD